MNHKEATVAEGRKKRPALAVECKNRFEALQDREDSDADMDLAETEEINEGKATTTNTISKTTTPKRKLPPLVLHGTINNHKEFIKLTKDTTNHKFHIKYLTDTVELYLTDLDDYNRLKGIWENKDIKFHTYTQKNEKKRTFVVKGFHPQVSVDDIKEELKSQSIPVTNVNLMRGTTRTLVMVSIMGNLNITYLNQNVQYINHTKISWEYYVSKRKITQCHRCQEWGHATSNCYANPVCLKCAENHLTKDCIKSKQLPAKCANCGGDHPANATICDAYKKRHDMIEKNRQLQNQRRPMLKNKPTPTPDLRNDLQFPRLPIAQKNPWIAKPDVNMNIQNLGYVDHANIRSELQQPGNSDLTDFIALTEEVSKLNSKFNIKQMLVQVRNLTIQLENCKSQLEQFTVFSEFCRTMSKK